MPSQRELEQCGLCPTWEDGLGTALLRLSVPHLEIFPAWGGMNLSGWKRKVYPLSLSPPPPFPIPTVSMVEPAVGTAKENKAFSHLEGIPLWTSNVYSKQWSWNSFANKRSQEFVIVENIRLPTGRGCFQLTNSTQAFKHTSLWAELVFAETLHGPSDVTRIHSPSSYLVITLILRS